MVQDVEGFGLQQHRYHTTPTSKSHSSSLIKETYQIVALAPCCCCFGEPPTTSNALESHFLSLREIYWIVALELYSSRCGEYHTTLKDRCGTFALESHRLSFVLRELPRCGKGYGVDSQYSSSSGLLGGVISLFSYKSSIILKRSREIFVFSAYRK